MSYIQEREAAEDVSGNMPNSAHGGADEECNEPNAELEELDSYYSKKQDEFKNNLLAQNKLPIQVYGRSVHGSYVKRWKEEIGVNGFTNCLFTNCNYSSLYLAKMVYHYKSCKNVPISDLSVCTICGRCFDTPEEKNSHEANCHSSSNEESAASTSTLSESDNWLGIVCPFCKINTKSKQAMKSHLETCGGNGKKDDMLSQGSISTILRIITEKSNVLLQRPSPSPSGCLRRRVYGKNNLNAWEEKFVEQKFIPCQLKNCSFIALSIEDMCLHYGSCTEDPNYAPVRCPECGGGVTSEQLLSYHLENSHNSNSLKVSEQNPSREQCGETPGENSISCERIEELKEEEKENGKSSGSGNCDDSIFLTKSAPASEKPSEKRKRGRPPKSKESAMEKVTTEVEDCGTEDSVTENNSDSTKVPRRKGRPRKAVNPMYAEYDVDISDEDDYCVKLFQTSIRTPSSVKRARGRPRKSSITSNGDKSFVKEPAENSFNNNVEEGSRIDESINETMDGVMPDSSSTPVFSLGKRKRGKARRESDMVYIDEGLVDVSIEVNDGDDEDFSIDVEPKKKRGPYQKRNVTMVSCVKCSESVPSGAFLKHNYKKHNGLSWREGDEPPDIGNESVIVGILRDVFKLNKVFKCEECGNVKKSVFGFLSHIQNCGKTEEEQEKLKVTCDICGRSVKPYSMPMHMRTVHNQTTVTATLSSEEENEPLTAATKRQSAVKAVDMLKKVLQEDKAFVSYKKGSAIPIVAPEFKKNWIKELAKSKKATCTRKGCNSENPVMSLALEHFFNCPTIPDSYFQCLICHFYASDDAEIKSHCNWHIENDGKKKKADECMEEYAISTDVDEDDDEIEDEEKENASTNENSSVVDTREREVIVKVEDEGVAEEEEEVAAESDDMAEDSLSQSQSLTSSKCKKWKRGVRSDEIRDESKREHTLRKNWATLENLRSTSNITVYRSAFIKEYKRQLAVPFSSYIFPELHTSLSDWTALSNDEQSKYMPLLPHSLPFQFRKGTTLSDLNRLNVFDAIEFEDSWTMFVGGPVLTMSWCNVDIKRAFLNARQYLAVSVSSQIDSFLDFTGPKETPNIIQIWDMGLSDQQNAEKPKMVMGLATDWGDILGLTWSPMDVTTSANSDFLPRMGLLGATFEDSRAFIFSLCDPSVLYSEEHSKANRIPIYKVKPAVELVRFGFKGHDPCLRLAWGYNGVIVAGYKSGTIAIWHLSTLNTISARIPCIKKTFILTAVKTFKPYNYPVSAVALCPSNENLLASGSYDRVLSFWDLSKPIEPYRVLQTGLIDKILWLKNWPAFVFISDDSTLTLDVLLDLRWRKQHTSCIANIKDFSFNDWTFTACFANEAGEVLIRHLKDPFIEVTKSKTKDNSLVSLLEARIGGENSLGEKDEFQSYEEANENGAKLIFTEYTCKNKDPNKTPKYCRGPCFAAYPLTNVNHVVFNPNYRHFVNLAMGYQCGMMRLIRLKQNDPDLKDLLKKHDQTLSDLTDDTANHNP